jgi:hypothetical protein
MGTEYYIIAKRLSDNNIVSVFNLGKMSGGQAQSDLYNAAVSANTEEAGKQLRIDLLEQTPLICAVAFLMDRAELLHELLAFINKHCYCTNEFKSKSELVTQYIKFANDNGLTVPVATTEIT